MSIKLYPGVTTKLGTVMSQLGRIALVILVRVIRKITSGTSRIFLAGALPWTLALSLALSGCYADVSSQGLEIRIGPRSSQSTVPVPSPSAVGSLSTSSQLGLGNLVTGSPSNGTVPEN
jgi:hypothetical protein